MRSFINKVIILIFLSLNSIISFGGKNYSKGWIIKIDGSRNHGYIKPFFGEAKEITFKLKKEDKKEEKLLSSNIQEIGVINEMKKDTSIFHKTKIAFYGWKNKLKVDDKIYWAAQVFNSEKIKGFHVLYENTEHQKTAIGSNFITNAVKAINVKFPDDEYLIHLSEIYTSADPLNVYDKNMRNNFKRAIEKKCPDLEVVIDKKKYELSEFIEMLKTYDENCK